MSFYRKPLSFALNKLRHTSSMPPKIIIIGAGAAGIAAASHLLTKGISDIKILEAENRLGGRIKSTEFCNSIVDLGAQWCHGQEHNIVYELSKNLNVLGGSSGVYQNFTYFLSNGRQIDADITEKFHRICEHILTDTQATVDFTGNLGDYFVKMCSEKINQQFNNTEIPLQLLETYHKLFLSFEGASTWHDISLKKFFEYETCAGDQHLHWKENGFKTILDILMKKIPQEQNKLPVEDQILYNKTVNKICWGSNDVQITCTDGTSFNCDHVICTISLGVLKNMLHNFVPTLPQQKIESIQRMQIGSVHKIFLKFPYNFWSPDNGSITIVLTENDKKNLNKEFPNGVCSNGRNWLADFVGFYAIDNDPKMLLGWVVGKMIEEVENLSDEIIQSGCEYMLEKFCGIKYKISSPEAILRSFWKTSSNFNGCWTYRSQRECENCIENLITPLMRFDRPVVLFAGEATHLKYHSTVHGAIETGYREADRILKFYKKNI